jgi:hypothetical protein
MSDTKYNGWTNYATWRINLEIFDGWDANHLDSLTMGDNTNLHDQLKDYVEELICESGVNKAVDYALAFLQDVNWHEIAEHLVQDHIAENQEEEVYDEFGVNTKNSFNTEK